MSERSYHKNYLLMASAYFYNIHYICQRLLAHSFSPTSNANIARYAKVIRFKNKKKINHYNVKIKTSQGYKHYSFVKAFVQDPKSIGSICPSSPVLCKAIVNLIPKGDGLILDLGSGTGVISKSLLELGFEPAKIVAIENSTKLSQSIKECMPNINVICGDARELDLLIAKLKTEKPELADLKIHAIISSLPFQSIPKVISDSILDQIKENCKAHGAYLLQYTYALWTFGSLNQQGFQSQKHRYVLRNVPPARVDLYSYK